MHLNNVQCVGLKRKLIQYTIQKFNINAIKINRMTFVLFKSFLNPGVLFKSQRFVQYHFIMKQ